MKKIYLAILMLAIFSKIVAQSNEPSSQRGFYNTHIKRNATPKKGMFYADVSPLFFTQNGWAFALGYEKKRIQSGLNFVGAAKLGTELSTLLFLDSEQLNVSNNLGTEWMLNYFLRPDRKGFYVGSILGYSQFNINKISNVKTEKAISVYGDLRAGFRWFPFREYFYIDAAYGFSKKIDSTKSDAYVFKNDVSFFPFLNVGFRFNLKK
jgi:hypothetical protein